jgi:hypothetical protein
MEPVRAARNIAEGSRVGEGGAPESWLEPVSF